MPYCTLGAHSLYYELTGNGAKTLVLFNGITMSTPSWTYMLPALEAHYRVLRLDFLGQGQSSKPQTLKYALSEQSDLAAALMDQLGIDKIYLTGLSYGGMAAQHFTRRHPQKVDKLLLASTLAWCDAASASMCDSWVAAEQAGGLDLRYQISIPWLFSSRFLATHGEMLPDLKKLSELVDWPSVVRLINGLKEHDARTWLDAIRAPTLVLVGNEDRLTPLYQSEQLATRIPGARLEILAGSGHVLHLEAADAFNRAITGFCPP
jgi:3-oxoadipate enol-lactonase